MALKLSEDVTKTLTDRGTPIKKKGDNGIDKNGFLKILAAQLSNLDPTQNQDSSQYVAQMAQFASLEQMQNLNNTMSDSAYHQLVGKEVTLNEFASDGKTNIQGYVTEVIKRSTGTFVKMNINGTVKEVDVTKVIGIVQSTDGNTSANNRTALNSDFIAASALADKQQNVVLAELDDNGKTVLVKGKVVGAYLDTVEGATVKIKVDVLDEDGNTTGKTKTYDYGNIVRAGDLTSDDMNVKLPTDSSSSSSGSSGNSSSTGTGSTSNTGSTGDSSSTGTGSSTATDGSSTSGTSSSSGANTIASTTSSASSSESDFLAKIAGI